MVNLQTTMTLWKEFVETLLTRLLKITNKTLQKWHIKILSQFNSLNWGSFILDKRHLIRRAVVTRNKKVHCQFTWLKKKKVSITKRKKINLGNNLVEGNKCICRRTRQRFKCWLKSISMMLIILLNYSKI